jgi:hypothetical protein
MLDTGVKFAFISGVPLSNVTDTTMSRKWTVAWNRLTGGVKPERRIQNFSGSGR